ncbi:MAG: EamA family transporter [Deltaproteobacteria bacterium]|nr:MAG: EamA family transporter [Deltaproteobacteria bacterium]
MSRLQANAVLVLTAMIWGSSFVVQQIGTAGLGSVTFTGGRFLLGGLLVLPFAVLQYRNLRSREKSLYSRDWFGLFATGCVLLTAGALQQHGILQTTVTNSGFLTALYVPLVPLLTFVFLRKKVHPAVWPASIGCCIGTFILSGAKDVAFATGDLWVVASTFFWAGHVILVGIMAHRTRAPLVVAATQFCVCGLLGLIIGLIFESQTAAQFVEAIPGICYIGLFSVALGFTFQVIGQRYTPAADAAIILSSEMLFAALAGALFLGERLNLFQMSGGVLILASILFVELAPLLFSGEKR